MEDLGLLMTRLLTDFLKVDIVEGQYVVDSSILAKEATARGIPWNEVSTILGAPTVQIAKLHQWYKLGGFKNYVPSNPLISVLAKIDVDITPDQFKVGACGYFELSNANLYAPQKWGGGKINYILYRVHDSGRANGLLFGFVMEGYVENTSFWIDFNDKEALLATLAKYQYKDIQFKDGEVVTESLAFDEADFTIIRLVLKLLVYVNNPNEEFVEEFNKFSTKPRIAQEEQLSYTKRPFIKIGFNAEFLQLVTTEQFDVRGHFRWQPVGVGRLMRKLTFVKPHTRHREKFLKE